VSLVLLLLLAVVLLGYAVGGNVRRLKHVRIVGEPILLVAIVVQLVLPLLPWSRYLFYWLWLLSFPVMFLVCVSNLRKVGFAAIGSGVALNFIAIVSNGGMPVAAEAIIGAGYSGSPLNAVPSESLAHMLASSETRLIVMGDIMSLPGPDVIQGVVSVGDVLLMVGITVFLVSAMLCREDKVQSV